MRHLRTLLVALLLTIAATAAAPALSARALAPASQEQTAHEAEQGKEAEGGGWLPVAAKAFNFAVLAGVLVYFLRTPLMDYLSGRISKVREDLVTAAATRETATRQLAEIDAKLKALPAELDALRTRGDEEIAAERDRIEQAAETERQRLLEHTRREIDMRLRVARRELLEHAADLAVQVAAGRIRTTITPEDQTRLVDRYAAELAGGAR
jgi:F-type H+-transporting ATPase subunit b